MIKITFPDGAIREYPKGITAQEIATSISEGLPKEIELRKKQYEYYRDLLLTFPLSESGFARLKNEQDYRVKINPVILKSRKS